MAIDIGGVRAGPSLGSGHSGIVPVCLTAHLSTGRPDWKFPWTDARGTSPLDAGYGRGAAVLVYPLALAAVLAGE